MGSISESEPRSRFQGIDSASLCSLAGRNDSPICRTGPPGIDPWNRFLGSLNVHKFGLGHCTHSWGRAQNGAMSICPRPVRLRTKVLRWLWVRLGLQRGTQVSAHSCCDYPTPEYGPVTRDKSVRNESYKRTHRPRDASSKGSIVQGTHRLRTFVRGHMAKHVNWLADPFLRKFLRYGEFWIVFYKLYLLTPSFQSVFLYFRQLQLNTFQVRHNFDEKSQAKSILYPYFLSRLFC